MLQFILGFLCITQHVLGQGLGNWTTSPFNPPSMPLAVKSPYVNAWAPLGFNTTGSNGIYGASPRLWESKQSENLGWYASIIVDGKPYQLLGGESLPTIEHATQVSFIFTPTRSSYSLQPGPINVTLTFLSPIEATDLLHQSMPFSYMYFTVEPNDGNSHSVQVYADITGEWISGDDNLDSNWTINESTNFVYLQMDLTSPGPYQEIANRPQDATLYHAMKKSGSNVSWQIGPANDIRSFFANGTGLNGTAEAGHHPVGVPSFDTLGIAYNVGIVSSLSEPIAYTLGVVRDPVVRYTNHLVQEEDRRAYYWSNFSNIHDVIEDVIDHFDDALSASISLDNKIIGDASQISGEYGDILSLSTRQAMGAFEYTVLDENGTFNALNVKAFMKDMGSVGSGGVNAVDVIYAAMPVYLYLSPAILGYLLNPLMDYQESIQYANLYAAQDLGSTFPNATGNSERHDQQIEHSASMLIMSLAHAQGSGDRSLLSQHYNLLNEWASYLENNTMTPGDQTTSISDGITSTNQSNLALKGIIAIGAMAKISQYTGHSDDQNHYNDIAQQYAQQWTTLVSSSGLLTLNFRSGPSGMMYNLYADKLLQLDLFNSSVYHMHTSFCKQQTALWKYGIPLDSSNSSSITRSDWMMFAAASVTDTSVRDAMISQVHAYASVNGDQNFPFPVLYNAGSGSGAGGLNSPAQGAMFALLALNLPIQQLTAPASGAGSGGDSGNSRSRPIIIGATIGSITGIMLLVGMLTFLYRRRNSALKSTGRIEPAIFPAGRNPTPSVVPVQNTTKSGWRARNRTQNPPTSELSSGSVSDANSSWMGRFQLLLSFARPPRDDSTREDWRTEFENLRREVERIRAERAAFDGAPPTYNE